MSDRRHHPPAGRLALWLLVGAVLVAAPLSLTGFWLQIGLFAMAAAIGAIGLTLLVGVTGQLSLAHAFFVAVGAYGYAFLSASGDARVAGAGLPAPAAALGAVALAGLAGALFSPIAGRLRGIYLGLASLGLVFAGQHILHNAAAVTGGFNGRDAAPFNLFGFSFTATDPDVVVLGVPYGALERLWYLGLVLLGLSYWYARNLLRGRPGRALIGVRDSEVAAAVMGVDVRRYKAAAFTVSSAYAGLAGVLLALVFGRIVPDSFRVRHVHRLPRNDHHRRVGFRRGRRRGRGDRHRAAPGPQLLQRRAAVPRPTWRARHRRRRGGPAALRCRGDRGAAVRTGRTRPAPAPTRRSRRGVHQARPSSHQGAIP